jgi:TLC domain
MWQNSHAFTTTPSASKEPDGHARETDIPIITTQSRFANNIIGYETGYLLQDSLVLLYAYRNARNSRSSRSKAVNYLHLSMHHALMGSAILYLQRRIAAGRTPGVLVVVAMHLMNASSVPGTIRWFLIQRSPGRKSLIANMTILYLASFAIVRIGLFYFIIYVFGMQQGISTWRAVGKMRIPCRIGIGTILLVNTAWLTQGIRSAIRRNTGSTNIIK